VTKRGALVKFMLWCLGLVNLACIIVSTRALRLAGEWGWWVALGFWFLLGVSVTLAWAVRAVAGRMGTGAPGSLVRPLKVTPQGEKGE
jgi:membrane protein implicated in regulation of membrane protease activity